MRWLRWRPSGPWSLSITAADWPRKPAKIVACRVKVYVLRDASNSSATFQFAQIVQQCRLGTLVGQPSGGSQRGINGGAFFFLHLPHSGIAIDLPLIGSFPAAARPDSGLTPDVIIRPTLRDISKATDSELAILKAVQRP